MAFPTEKVSAFWLGLLGLLLAVYALAVWATVALLLLEVEWVQPLADLLSARPGEALLALVGLGFPAVALVLGLAAWLKTSGTALSAGVLTLGALLFVLTSAARRPRET